MAKRMIQDACELGDDSVKPFSPFQYLYYTRHRVSHVNSRLERRPIDYNSVI